MIDLVLKAEAWRYDGLRKIVRAITWTPKRFPSVTLDQLGYTKAKVKQLQRNYWSPEAAEQFRQLIEKRDGHNFSALAMKMHGQQKRSQSMGFCMDTLVMSYQSDGQCEATMFYRSTEVTRKFAADLTFLPWVYEQLGVEPSRTTFMFANAYWSGVFLATIFLFEEPIPFLERLRKLDPIAFKMGTRALFRSSCGRDRHFPYSPEAREHEILWSSFPASTIKTINNYLTTYLDKSYVEKHR